MKDWKDIKIDGITEINKVVAVFEVWDTMRIPFGKYKIKIIENVKGGYIGIPNIAVKDSEDGTPNWISGLGETIAEALEDTIKYFLGTLNMKDNYTDEDFIWSAVEDF